MTGRARDVANGSPPRDRARPQPRRPISRADGVDLLGIGEMGIGNTTAASALAAAFTGAAGRVGHRPGDRCRRRRPATQGCARSNKPFDFIDPNSADPDRCPGERRWARDRDAGRSHRRGRHDRSPDRARRVHHRAAALVVGALEPSVAKRLIAGHRSTEPGHAIVLEWLGLRPILELDLRLGEGSGAALAIGVITAAVDVRDGMATFEIGGRGRSVVTLVVLVRHAPTSWSGKAILRPRRSATLGGRTPGRRGPRRPACADAARRHEDRDESESSRDSDGERHRATTRRGNDRSRRRLAGGRRRARRGPHVR